MAEYRFLALEECPPIVLWSETFHLDPPCCKAMLDERDESLAAFEEGEVVSSVHVNVREMHDRAGHPLRVGSVSNVCSHLEYRKEGHPGRLLEVALDEIERRGRDLSFVA